MKLSTNWLLFGLIIGLIGCTRSADIPDAQSTAKPSTAKPLVRSNSTENSQPSSTSSVQKPPQTPDQKTETLTSNSSNPSPSTPSKSDNSPTQKTAPTATPKPDTAHTARPIQKTEYDFPPESEPIVPVGNFEFQLKQASLKKELVNSATQKSYTTQGAAQPSYYLFVELALTNRSDRPAVDLFRYQLDCGDGKPIDNAAEAAVAYRKNYNLDVFAEIQPGETGSVADGFLVPESCLNSDRILLNISSTGEGNGEIPIPLK